MVKLVCGGKLKQLNCRGKEFTTTAEHVSSLIVLLARCLIPLDGGNHAPQLTAGGAVVLDIINARVKIILSCANCSRKLMRWTG